MKAKQKIKIENERQKMKNNIFIKLLKILQSVKFSEREYIKLKMSTSWVKYRSTDFGKNATKWSTTKKHDVQLVK